MQITIDPTIGTRGRWAEGVQRANNILEQLLERSFEPKAANWVLTHDQHHQPVLRLTLLDATTSVAQSFTPEELEDPEELWFQLNELLGDLLEVKSHKLLEKLRQSLDLAGEGDDAR
jgi:hypothetical protein